MQPSKEYLESHIANHVPSKRTLFCKCGHTKYEHQSRLNECEWFNCDCVKFSLNVCK